MGGLNRPRVQPTSKGQISVVTEEGTTAGGSESDGDQRVAAEDTSDDDAHTVWSEQWTSEAESESPELAQRR